jgi:pyruvate dehydrogenase E2 component (dihydrolipoamide acetyltransferase)
MALDIVMPRLSDSMEEGTIVSWLVADGDTVELGQPLAEIETDKATVAYEADAAGMIVIRVPEGATVAVGVVIAVIGQAGSVAPPDPAPMAGARNPAVVAAPPDPVSVAATPDPISLAATPDAPASRPKASPLARRIADEQGVNLATLAGSGPAGRIIRADVERAAGGANGGGGNGGDGNGGGGAIPEVTSDIPDAGAAKGESTLHELTRTQRTVARRMAESRATVPDIELRSEVDMGTAAALHARLRELSDPSPSLNDLIVKAAALALREFPQVNGSYRDSNLETFSRVNIGIAVATDDALVVPTIFDADRKSLGEIGRTARELAARVRDGSVTPAQLAGATFTVSNLGMYGVDSFSAVINPPQAAILAVGALKQRAVVNDVGELVARPTIVLTLACDHRIVYGADGARFLARVRELLERPDALVL